MDEMDVPDYLDTRTYPEDEVIHAEVARRPNCDFHEVDGGPAHGASYDFKTKQGPWAFGCTDAYLEHRAEERLGLGKGQLLIVQDDSDGMERA